jgi:DNA-binding transcriptional LysR family regulator
MTLEELRSVVAVHECRSFSAAARRLGCSQPAVSQHIQRLETELRLTLFERQPRGIRTTSAGDLLVRAAKESLAILDHVGQRFSALRDGEDGMLTLTTGGTTVKHFMRGAVRQFRRALPAVKMQFRAAMSSAECIEMLFREPIDLAFVTIGDEVEGVRQQPVLELDYVWLTKREDPLAKRPSITLDELHGREYIGLVEGPRSRKQLMAALSRQDIQLDATMTVCDWDTAIHLVELGLGSSIVPSWFGHASSAIAIPIEGLDPIHVGWAVRSTHDLLKPAKTFMRLLHNDLAARAEQPGVRLLRR